MIAASLVLFAAQPTFYEAMNDYIACVQSRTPADVAAMDRAVRARAYRAAAAPCRHERARAIAAAVSNRPPEQTAEEARLLAIDIIDTLDPSSN